MVEALGFEEMITRDREKRQAQTSQPQITQYLPAPQNGITEVIQKAKQFFTPENQSDFSQFFEELNFTNILSVTLQNDMPGNYVFTMSTLTYNLSLNARTVIEMMAQLMNQPINLPSELHVRTAPPFIQNIEEITNHWISEMLCEYRKIFSLNDPRVHQLCHNYWLSMSYPILVRLAYIEWENKNMDWKVGLKVKDIAAEYSKKNRDIKTDYDTQLGTETTKLKTQLSGAQRENKELWTKINIMNERLQNTRQDLGKQAGAIEEVHEKWKSEQGHCQELQGKIIELNKELKSLQFKINKQVDESGWVRDMSYTDEKPVFRNKVTKAIVIFPMSFELFKKEYELEKFEDGVYRFIKEGAPVFDIPESLADELTTQITESTKAIPVPKPAEKTELGVDAVAEKHRLFFDTNPTTYKVYNVLNTDTHPMGMTQEEAANTADVASGNIKTRHLAHLIKMSLVIEDKDEERKLRYKKSV